MQNVVNFASLNGTTSTEMVMATTKVMAYGDQIRV
jgi:hypothetical protein